MLNPAVSLIGYLRFLFEILQHWEFSCKVAHDGHFTQTELNVQFKFLVLQACEVWWVVNCTRFYVTDVLVSLWNNANNKFCEVDKPRKMIYADYSFRFSWGYECDCNVSFSIKLSFKCVCLCVSWAAGGCTRGPCSTRHWSMRVCVSWPIMISPTVLVFYEFSCACSARFTLFLFALWDTVRCSFCSSPLCLVFRLHKRWCFPFGRTSALFHVLLFVSVLIFPFIQHLFSVSGDFTVTRIINHSGSDLLLSGWNVNVRVLALMFAGFSFSLWRRQKYETAEWGRKQVNRGLRAEWKSGIKMVSTEKI